jgi:protein TonB
VKKMRGAAGETRPGNAFAANFRAAESAVLEAAMFEDSTFESTGTIHTGSRNWMAATFLTNSTILTAMVMIPLLFPQALPRLAMTFLLSAPLAPLEHPKPIMVPKNAVVVRSGAITDTIMAPSRIPDKVFIANRQEIAVPSGAIAINSDGNVIGALPGMPEYHHPRVVSDAPKGPMRVSSMVVEGMLLRKTVPVYPPIAHAAGVEGTVVLAAVIARDGTIQNLHVMSGSAMLQQAALDAVRTWRYRPYLLNGEPVEVETSINVIFKLH